MTTFPKRLSTLRPSALIQRQYSQNESQNHATTLTSTNRLQHRGTASCLPRGMLLRGKKLSFFVSSATFQPMRKAVAKQQLLLFMQALQSLA